MLTPTLLKNDKKAKLLILIFSILIFCTVSFLEKYNFSDKINLPFDKHIFAIINALINGLVSILLLIGLFTIKLKNYELHKKIMLFAMVLSIIFLISYVCHHLFAGDTIYGDTDGVKGLSEAEAIAAGSMRTVYLFLLITHIPLAGLVLPFILWAAYKALIGEFAQHKKLVRYIWPVWFYVAITGVIIYFMIKPYYH